MDLPDCLVALTPCFPLHLPHPSRTRREYPAGRPGDFGLQPREPSRPPLIGGSVPRAVNFLARDTLFQIPILGWYIRKLNAVPVNRDGGGGAGLKAILDRLNNGAAILLFPEGTRTQDGRLKPARSGIGLTVIKSKAPVVPIRLHGTFEAWGATNVFQVGDALK